MFAAKAAKTAVPTTVNAVGNVASDFIEAICDPIIPVSYTHLTLPTICSV